MDEELKVANRITESLRFFWTMGTGTPWNVQVCVECARMNVPDLTMQGALVWLAHQGYVSLTTWNKSLRREAHYWEYATPDAFFYNRDNANYVRVKPLVAF